MRNAARNFHRLSGQEADSVQTEELEALCADGVLTSDVNASRLEFLEEFQEAVLDHYSEQALSDLCEAAGSALPVSYGDVDDGQDVI
mmetsp:Transcript_79338/g.140026  ORF Transcript_79338/g.140026 Transcript_79338/m.140026 type:complete len:87 (-) Transcript_79338:30-290(-)